MRVESRLFPTLAIAIVTMLPVITRAACDLTHFGAAAQRSCARTSEDCVPGHVPEQVKKIRRGAVLEWVGLAANDGRASWRALDIDRREIVVVERYAGSRVGRAPRIDTATDNEYVNVIGEGDSRRVDHVRRWPLSPARFDALACLANGAWSARPMPVKQVSDGAGRFYLLSGEQAQVDSAVGRFGGPPAKFESMVDSVVKQRRPGETAR